METPIKRSSSESELCCTLPFCLQDLCTIAVVNVLDSYSTELLASMPKWLRHRILACLPPLELNRLESSAIAKDIDSNKLWESILPTHTLCDLFQSIPNAQDTKRQKLSVREIKYQLDVCKNHPSERRLIERDQLSRYYGCHKVNLTAEFVRDVELYESQENIPPQRKYTCSISCHNFLPGSVRYVK